MVGRRAEPAKVKGWLPRLVATIPASIHVKLLVAFFAIAMLLVVLGAVGLEVLTEANRHAEDLAKLQQRIETYQQLQRDTSSSTNPIPR
jgi:CHASE3 domain sensor protein